jgi:hypothetical protein
MFATLLSLFFLSLFLTLTQTHLPTPLCVRRKKPADRHCRQCAVKQSVNGFIIHIGRLRDGLMVKKEV